MNELVDNDIIIQINSENSLKKRQENSFKEAK